MKRITKPFKVVMVSSNQNSFGLTGMILLARDGEAYEVAASSLYVKPKGHVLKVPIVGTNQLNFARLGFELPRKLDVPPAGVVKAIWK